MTRRVVRLEKEHLDREIMAWVGTADAAQHAPPEDPLHLRALGALKRVIQNLSLFADSGGLAERHELALGDG